MKSSFIKHGLITALATTSLIGLSAPAFAQTAPAASESEDSGEIIVTARRRDETLQSTPVAITAINAAQLESKASVNIGDLMGVAPNLLITQQNSGGAAANLAIRGLTYADIEKSQEPTVGVVVDGVFIGTSTGQFFDFFDIQQIEVLRGPQGTLFGRNTIGGVINIKRTRPTGELGGKLEATYGSFKSWAGRSVINVPIIGKEFAAKFFYFHNQTDGFYRHGVTGKRAGGNKNDNFGASFLVQPDGSGFDALLTVEKQKQKFDVVNSNISQTGEIFCFVEPANECNRNTTSDLYTVFTEPGTSYYTAPSVTLEMNYDLGGIKLTSVSGYRRSEEDQTQDFDSSTTPLYYARRQQAYRQWSQELRASGKISDQFDYVVGAFIFDSKYALNQETGSSAANVDLDPAPQDVIGKTKSYAFFGDFNWAFADRFRLSFGGRYTHDKKFLSNGFGGTLVGQGTASFSKFTPKVGIDFRPNSDTMFYASWSRGYRSGGFSPRAGEAGTASVGYRPEVVDSYETGVKLNMLDHRLQFNLAGFYSKYRDIQQNTTIACTCASGNQTLTLNAGSATIKGIEVDFTARPTDGLRLTGSMGYLTSGFKNFLAGGALSFGGPLAVYDYSNVNMIYSPKITASLGMDYTVPTNFGEVIANVGYRFIDKYDQQISVGAVVDATATPIVVLNNDPRVRSDRQGLLDASLSAKFDLGGAKAKISVYGRNLSNDRGPSAAFTVVDNAAGNGLWSFASAREPRSFGASLGLEF
jgi:iron complex outermembrane recepter protein